jgi:signal transduction histidine kinase
MNHDLLLIIVFLIIAVLFTLQIVSVAKIKKLERKAIDFSYNDLQILIDHLKDLLIEAERVAENLELSIRQKEDLLADMAELLELKLNRLEESAYSSESERSTKDRVLELASKKVDKMDIARQLGISAAEVELVLKLKRAT